MSDILRAVHGAEDVTETGADSEYAFGALVSVVAEDSANADRYTGLHWTIGVANLTNTVQINEQTNGGTMAVSVDYNGIVSAQHTLQVTAESSSGWSAAPDSVTTTVIAMGPSLDLVDQT